MEENPDREYQIIRYLFSASFAASTLLALIVTLDDYLFIRVLFILIVFTVVSLILMSMLQLLGMPTSFFLSLAVVNMLLIIPELSLRLTDFHYETGIQFGYPRPIQFIRFELDPNLYWKLDPSYPGVNAYGFPGEEFTIPKPENTFRILYLGDSVTVQGYPQEVERLLNASHGGASLAFESVSLAVYGYSTYQGKILADRYGEILQPDLVVVLYGWNDHWLAYGAKDSEKEIDLSPLSQLAIDLHQFRLAQGIFWIGDRIRGVQNVPINEVRVPLGEYRENLLAIEETFVRISAPIMLITAPTSHYRLGVPDALVEKLFAQDEETAVTLHREYNQVVRENAEEKGIILLDLEANLDSLPEGDLESIFMEDGIHFTPVGVLEVADRIVQTIEEEILDSVSELQPLQ